MWNRKHSKIQLRTVGLKYGQFHTRMGNRLVVPEPFLNSSRSRPNVGHSSKPASRTATGPCSRPGRCSQGRHGRRRFAAPTSPAHKRLAAQLRNSITPRNSRNETARQSFSGFWEVPMTSQAIEATCAFAWRNYLLLHSSISENDSRRSALYRYVTNLRDPANMISISCKSQQSLS